MICVLFQGQSHPDNLIYKFADKLIYKSANYFKNNLQTCRSFYQCDNDLEIFFFNMANIFLNLANIDSYACMIYSQIKQVVLEQVQEQEQVELVQEQVLEDQALLLRHQAQDLQDSVCDIANCFLNT